MRPQINAERLLKRLRDLGEIGALPGGGVCRLALSEEDRAGRDQLVRWMEELGLAVSIDAIGNIWGIRPGTGDGPPVMIGSHIDTVATGGLYDGALGVMAGLEVVAALNDAGARTAHPLAVAAFTNEEGARFAPDMMGSGVHQGALDLSRMLAVQGIDGATLGEELARIGYAGDIPPKSLTPAAFLELHIEQGPVLERDGVRIGAVTGVQGISWTEFTISGQSNHAGTTPMDLRRDAGLAAARIAVEARAIASDFGPPQVATVGSVNFEPGLVNVVPERAVITVDLRNTDDERLKEAEARLHAAAHSFAEEEGCEITARSLARFAPVAFDETVVARIEGAAMARQLTVRRMPSGAGHDAQMFAPNCPTAMIFVPSKDGLSHNIAEHTEPAELIAGAEILLDVALDLLGEAQ
ncbi:hydantoinase/carbamoylase family amidase [Stappia sp. GBMRC 2046]|uniref:Hydantoinase/carbamoylase family amidase n=1 Tax=Stappia sediminis TaxID=2692190 RepID=A0A7X3LSZ1_9HYPH|nr:Zn-dependent hydrolase [Stappia sediminis]MXN64521.1 hydantoinase/carbamoylase family amidase [Stappia sediminis]